MKKSTIRIYSIIAFAVFPIIIILIGVIFCVRCKNAFLEPNVNFDEVTNQTQSGELWEALTIVEDGHAYVIYSMGDYYQFDDDNLIAFQGPSVEEIRDTIWDCSPGAYGDSYWEGEGKDFDFTTTSDFKEYLEHVKNTSYYNMTPDPDVITSNFSNVTLYNLSEYKGYAQDYNIGIGFSILFACLVIGGITLVVLLVELVIAVILKITVFKMKKEKQVQQ